MTSTTSTWTLKEYCDFIEENYKPLYPDLYTLKEEIFVPEFREIIKSNNPNKLKGFLKEVHPEIYTFDMLEPAFCKDLLEEMAHFENWCVSNELAVVRPNSMNNYGAILDTFGFYPFLQELMTDYVMPFSSITYADAGGGTLDTHHGFVVEYKIGKDVSLDFHVDMSDVTLNVCLGNEFKGGELYFRGVRCGICQQSEPLPEEIFEIEHIVGRAILHRGKHRHGARKIISGERYNLILWCNSTKFWEEQQNSNECPSWCKCPHTHIQEHEQEQHEH